MGTPWQIKVWEALLAIPSGKLVTYRHDRRKDLQARSACRAVGAAVGRNPISWLIPCHRVLGSNGALTGYHWGVARKRAMLAVESAAAGSVRKAQHVGHGVKARLLALAPKRRRHGAAREDRAVLGDVGEHDTFARTRQDHFVFADHRAAAQAGETDGAGRPRPGVSVAAADRVIGERDAAPVRCGFAQQQGRARRRIDLLAVMHFDDLDIEIGQGFRRALHQGGEQRHAQAHVAGFDDHRMRARGRGFWLRRPAKQPVVPMT